VEERDGRYVLSTFNIDSEAKKNCVVQGVSRGGQKRVEKGELTFSATVRISVLMAR